MRLKGGAVIRADIAGEVTGVSAVTGGVVAAGDALLEIMDLSTMRAEFQVDEYDVSAVTPGKTAQITVEGTGDVLEAPVTSVDKHAVQSGDLSYYTATAELNGITCPRPCCPACRFP
jgi:multidrug resistance efflux pump